MIDAPIDRSTSPPADAVRRASGELGTRDGPRPAEQFGAILDASGGHAAPAGRGTGARGSKQVDHEADAAAANPGDAPVPVVLPVPMPATTGTLGRRVNLAALSAAELRSGESAFRGNPVAAHAAEDGPGGAHPGSAASRATAREQTAAPAQGSAPANEPFDARPGRAPDRAAAGETHAASVPRGQGQGATDSARASAPAPVSLAAQPGAIASAVAPVATSARAAASRAASPDPLAALGRAGMGTSRRSHAPGARAAPMAHASRPAPALVEQAAAGLATALRKGSGTITMRLSPEGLGELRIEVAVREERVRARIEAGSAARALLVERREELRGALEARGLSVERIDIVGAPEAPGAQPPETGRGPTPDGAAQPEDPGGRAGPRGGAGDGSWSGGRDGGGGTGARDAEPAAWDGAGLVEASPGVWIDLDLGRYRVDAVR